MKKITAVALSAMLFAPATAWSQQSPGERIEAAFERATAAGIPTSLLETRVAEGRAKGVPMERIAAAVEMRATALTRARDAMSSARGMSAADLAAGADAIEAGIEAGALRSVIRQARNEDRPVAIAVLTYLHREEGLPVEQALARVSDALQRGPEALRSLPQSATARARGGSQGAPQGAGPPSGVPAPGGRPGGKPGGGQPGGG